MITLLHHADGPASYRLKVILDITLKGIEAPTDDVRGLFDEAQTQKRKVGCIERLFGGATYFTYDPANQAQHEVSLIAALATPKSDVHVEQRCGGYRK